MNDVESLTLSALFYEIGRFKVRADGSNDSFSKVGQQWLQKVFPSIAGTAEQHATLLGKAAKLALGYRADGLPPEPQEGDGALVSIFSLIDTEAHRSDPLFYYPEKASNICQYPKHRREISSTQMASQYKTLWESFDNECRSLNGSITVPQALFLLEKYTSYIPYIPSLPDDSSAGISLFDHSKLTAALASCLHLADKTSDSDSPFLLVGGDFSGVQDSVYRISSKGALKALRGRSFFLELLTEHVISEIFRALGLSAANILINGGAIFNLILPKTETARDVLNSARQRLNQYLLEKHDGKLYVALASVEISEKDLVNPLTLAEKWRELGRTIKDLKGRKFLDVLADKSQRGPFLQPQRPPKDQTPSLFEDAECPWCGRQTAQLKRIDWQDEEIYGCVLCLPDQLNLDDLDECQVCHRTALLSPLPPPREDVMACSLCRNLYHVGEHLYSLHCIIGTNRRDDKRDPLQKAIIKLPSLTKDEWIYYYFPKQARPQDCLQGFQSDSVVASFVINKWDLEWYSLPGVRLFALGNYPGFKARPSPKEAPPDCTQEVPLEFGELVGCAHGMKRLGVLRMDVDNLGDLFTRKLKECTLAHRMALSRAMTYFFKLHLNELCLAENVNVFPQEQQTRLIEAEKAQLRIRNAIIVYSGGDDLFIVGTWNDTVELAFDIHAAFKEYTGGRVTLSAGLIVQDENFPLYQMARFSKRALSAAKDNCTAAPCDKPEKDSFALFHSAFIFELQGDELRSHVPAALRWTDQISAQSCLELAQQMAACLGNGELRERWELIAPRSFLRNLFGVVEAAHQEGQLSLPKLAYALSRVSVADQQKQEKFEQELKPQLMSLGSKVLCYLHPALVWLEMRLRSEKEGSP